MKPRAGWSRGSEAWAQGDLASSSVKVSGLFIILLPCVLRPSSTSDALKEMEKKIKKSSSPFSVMEWSFCMLSEIKGLSMHLKAVAAVFL